MEVNEDFLKKIDQRLERLEVYIIGSPLQRDRAQWVKAYLKENGYICWSRIGDNKEALRLFKNNVTFHRSLDRMLDIFGWSIKKADQTYYFPDGFDIETVIKKQKWRNFKATDLVFHEYIVRQVILPLKRVNLLEWLRESYPQRPESWWNDVEDNVTDFIRRNGFKIRRNGDVFEVFQ
jgi:hypothetical protein